MLYEMRQYLIDRGRMDDSHDRMESYTTPLFAKHGMRVIGHWSALAGPRAPMFCYILEWRDFAEREAAWGAFYADPEWHKVRAATNAGSELVQENQIVYMKPNPAISQDEMQSLRSIDGLHQIIVQRAAVGQNNAIVDFLGSTYIPRLRAAGAHAICVCDVVAGTAMPTIVIIVAWPDAKSSVEGTLAFDSDEAMRQAYRAQRETFGAALLGSADIILARSAPYALRHAAQSTGSP